MGDAGPRLLAIAGSMREASFNRRLLRHAAGVAAESGAEIDLVELRALGLPLYDGDLEAGSGLPPEAVAFQERIAAAEGLLIACPEYNHSIPGAFKNAIDWASRPPGNPFPGKVAALLGASPSGAGAMRAQQHLRQVLTSRQVWVVPAQVTLSYAGDAFDGDTLTHESTQKQVQAAVGQLLEQIQRMRE